MNPFQRLADNFDNWVRSILTDQLSVAEKEYRYLMQKPTRSERDFNRIASLEKEYPEFKKMKS